MTPVVEQAPYCFANWQVPGRPASDPLSTQQKYKMTPNMWGKKRTYSHGDCKVVHNHDDCKSS